MTLRSCWQTRRRIPCWIRGGCSPSEAATVARHLERCSACAAEAALEWRLREVAAALPDEPPDREERRARLWARVAAATVDAAPSPAVREAAHRSWGTAPLGRLSSPARLMLAALPLLVAVTLAGHLVRSGQGPRPGAAGAVADAGLERGVAPGVPRLWDAEPSAADPMGPTTAVLLALLEEQR